MANIDACPGGHGWPGSGCPDCRKEAALDPLAILGTVLDAFDPFLNIHDHAAQASKIIHKDLDGLTPITVTVTKAQFLAAVAAHRRARGDNAEDGQ